MRDPCSRIAKVSVVHGTIRYRGEMNRVATWDAALGERLRAALANSEGFDEHAVAQ